MKKKTKNRATFFTSSATEVGVTYFNDPTNKSAGVNGVVSNRIDNKFMDLTKEILQEKFKRGEIVLTAMDAYQVVGNEMAGRIHNK